MSPEGRKSVGEKNSKKLMGRSKSPEVRKRMSVGRKKFAIENPRIVITNGIISRRYPKDQLIPEGFTRGLTFSAEALQNIRETGKKNKGKQRKKRALLSTERMVI